MGDLIDAMNSRQLEKIRDLVTDDFVDHGSPVPLPPGPDGYIAILTFVTTVLQVRYEVHDVIFDGETVAIRATAHGVNAVTPQGIEPTGRPFAMKTGTSSASATAGCASTGASATSSMCSIRSARWRHRR